MRKNTLTGNIKRHRAFHSRVLGNRRDVLVYLPPGYRRFSTKRYPVLYLHDGQNVFDAATSFAGVEWGVDETAQRLIHRKLIEPLIVVAVANIGEERVHEYAPTPGLIEPKDHPRKRSRGLARIYGQFLIEELKPFIDKKYRTKRDAEFAGLATGARVTRLFSRQRLAAPCRSSLSRSQRRRSQRSRLGSARRTGATIFVSAHEITLSPSHRRNRWRIRR